MRQPWLLTSKHPPAPNSFTLRPRPHSLGEASVSTWELGKSALSPGPLAGQAQLHPWLCASTGVCACALLSGYKALLYQGAFIKEGNLHCCFGGARKPTIFSVVYIVIK